MAEVEKNKETEIVTSKVNKPEKKKSPKSDKPSFGKRIVKFFKDYKSEIKKIVWYGKNQTIKSTGLVIVCMVVVSAVISLLDLGFSNAIMWLGTLI